MDTYDELYSMESKQLLAKSSIGNFCAVRRSFDSGSEKPARHILRQRGRAHSDDNIMVKQIEG